MSVKKQETNTHRILQKSTGKKIGYARIFSQYEDVEVKDTKLIHCDKISNNNEVVNILNEDLNLSSSEDEEVDYEDMIMESMKVSCLFLKMGFRKCGAKIHGDSGPEKPNPPDLHQYRPETSLATGGIWEEKLSGAWGMASRGTKFRV